MNGHTYAITGGNGSENWCVGRIAGRNAAALELPGCRNRGLDLAWRR